MAGSDPRAEQLSTAAQKHYEAGEYAKAAEAYRGAMQLAPGCDPPQHLGCRTKGGVLPSWYSCRLFLGPGFRLGARWNRLGEPVKTRKKRGKRGGNGRDMV